MPVVLMTRFTILAVYGIL